MSVEQVLVAVCIAMVGVLTVLVVLSSRQVARLRREVAGLSADLDAGALRLDDIGTTDTDSDASRVPGRTGTDAAFVITGMDTEATDRDAPADPARIEGRLFADIVARETVVKTAGLVHGLRRAASPEVRNRVRFEMRQELKHSRRRRRADLKEALRDLRRRQREADAASYGDPDRDRTDGARTDGGTAA